MIHPAEAVRRASGPTDSVVQNGTEHPPTVGFLLFHAKNKY